MDHTKVSAEKAAESERKRLGFYSEETPRSARTGQQARGFYKDLRRFIESMNIFVFQRSIPIEEVRGLTISEKLPVVIMVSSKDTLEARIFTLLHEYGHVLLRGGGICRPGESLERPPGSGQQGVEKWCNKFAASFLMPTTEFRDAYVGLAEKHTDPQEIVESLSKRFHTSKYATNIRVQEIEPDARIRDVYENIPSASADNAVGPDPTNQRQGSDPATLCLSQNGEKFVSLVLESRYNNSISSSDVTDYLDIKLKHIDKLEGKVG